jgi:WD40 repeat protein
LSGHSTPVECVQFGHTEELVCAGSQTGALKIWDLEAAKIVRTLTGHKATVRCMDFHPYGDFLTSGSLDTSIKVCKFKHVCLVSETCYITRDESGSAMAQVFGHQPFTERPGFDSRLFHMEFVVERVALGQVLV